MAARGHRQPSFEGRAAQAPGMMRHGPFPGSGHTVGLRSLETAPHPDIAENKMLAQVAEIERLAGDNHRLAATHGALRQELVAAQHEISRIKAQIRSIETESDIQIRVLMERIAKMEGDIRADEHVKKELQHDNEEAQSVIQYAKIAMQLKNKIVQDVTLRRRWVSRKENSKRKKEGHNLSKKTKNRKEVAIQHAYSGL